MQFDDRFIPPEVWLVTKEGEWIDRIPDIESVDVDYSVEEPTVARITAIATPHIMRLQQCDGEYLLGIEIRGYKKLLFPTEFKFIEEESRTPIVDLTAVCGLPMIRSIYLGDMSPDPWSGSFSQLLDFNASTMLQSAQSFSAMGLVLSLATVRGGDPYVTASYVRKTFGEVFDEVAAPNELRMISEHEIVGGDTIRGAIWRYTGGNQVWPKPVIFASGERDIQNDIPVVLNNAGHISSLTTTNYPREADVILGERSGSIFRAWRNSELNETIWASRVESVSLPNLGDSDNQRYLSYLSSMLQFRRARQEYKVTFSDSAPIKFGNLLEQGNLRPSSQFRTAETWVREGNRIKIVLDNGNDFIREIVAVKISWSGDDYSEEYTLSGSRSRPRTPSYMSGEEMAKLDNVVRRS